MTCCPNLLNRTYQWRFIHPTKVDVFVDWKLILLSKVVKQHKAQAKKKWDEASQHPGAEVERIVTGIIKANEVKSDCECESDCSNDDSPAQESFVGV